MIVGMVYVDEFNVDLVVVCNCFLLLGLVFGVLLVGGLYWMLCCIVSMLLVEVVNVV